MPRTTRKKISQARVVKVVRETAAMPTDAMPVHVEAFDHWGQRKKSACGATGAVVGCANLAEVTCPACLKAAALWYQEAFHHASRRHDDCGCCDDD